MRGDTRNWGQAKRVGEKKRRQSGRRDEGFIVSPWTMEGERSLGGRGASGWNGLGGVTWGWVLDGSRGAKMAGMC